MGSLVVELWPFAAGLAAAPAAVAACILLLGSKRPLANATAFAGAFALVDSAVAAVVLAGGARASWWLGGGRAGHRAALSLGLLLLGLAVASVLRRPPGVRRTEPRRLTTIDLPKPRLALGLGLAVVALSPNPLILAAGTFAVAAASVSTPARLAATALLVLAAQLGLAACLAWHLARPASSARGLPALRLWLLRNDRLVELTVLVLFGALFTAKGASTL
jgi:hypothetical protein